MSEFDQVITDSDGNEKVIFADGTTVGLGLLPADKMVMSKEPLYTSAFPTIARSDWPKSGKAGGLRQFMPFRWNQGSQNSCFGHGTGAAFTSAWNFSYNENKPVYEFSPTFIYGLANGGVDQGARPEQGIKILKEGVCLRSTVGAGNIYSQNFPSTAYEERKRFKADQIFLITSFDEMVSAALRGQAMAPGIFIGNNYRPDANGILPKWDGRRVGGHDIATIGEYEYIEGRGHGLWVLGSWGNTFGLDGWQWHHESYFGNGQDGGGLDAFGCLCIVSCLPDPNDMTPTPKPHE